MPLQNAVEFVHIERAAFDELEDAGEVLGAARLQRDGGQVFCRHHACSHAFKVRFQRLRQGFLHQGIAGRQKLHRPGGDNDVFLFRLVTARGEIIVNRGERKERAGIAALK